MRANAERFGPGSGFGGNMPHAKSTFRGSTRLMEPGIDAAGRRRDYRRGTLLEADAGDDPWALFARWWRDAADAGLDEPNAMTLATADADGHADARIVLLKGADARGFVWFTNRESAKGQQLAARPHAALVFHWSELDRQVRARGPVAPVTAEETAAYFASRPRGSRIGAWASPQSQVLPDRAALDDAQAAAEARFGADGPVPVPPHWGGYRLRPEAIEFWQGRPSRLHDRLRFVRSLDTWRRERLAP
jgi:pyridoxamine 5'-phosphate oxidase